MKKYIIPAVEVTAMHHEGSMMLESIKIGGTDGSGNEITVGGDGDTSPGQLTNKYGWDSADWSE